MCFHVIFQFFPCFPTLKSSFAQHLGLKISALAAPMDSMGCQDLRRAREQLELERRQLQKAQQVPADARRPTGAREASGGPFKSWGIWLWVNNINESW